MAILRAAVCILESDSPPETRVAHALSVLLAGLSVVDLRGPRATKVSEPLSAAERQRRWREKRERNERDVTAVTGGVGGGLSSDLSLERREKTAIASEDQEHTEEDQNDRTVIAGANSRNENRNGERNERDVTRNGATVTAGAPLVLTEAIHKPTKAKSTRCPESTDPGAFEFCRVNDIPPPAPGSESADFLDYWAASTKKDAVSTKWAAKWRSRPAWTRRENQMGKRNGKIMLQPGLPPGQTWAGRKEY